MKGKAHIHKVDEKEDDGVFQNSFLGTRNKKSIKKERGESKASLVFRVTFA
jgi:hypothetical protein